MSRVHLKVSQPDSVGQAFTSTIGPHSLAMLVRHFSLAFQGKPSDGSGDAGARNNNRRLSGKLQLLWVCSPEPVGGQVFTTTAAARPCQCLSCGRSSLRYTYPLELRGELALLGQGVTTTTALRLTSVRWQAKWQKHQFVMTFDCGLTFI